MALVTKATVNNVGLDTNSGMRAGHLAGNLYAGEALDSMAPCYIKASDGKVYMSNGTAANEAAGFDGFTAEAYASGEAVSLYGINAIFHYAAGTLTPGAKLYIAATAGRLDTVATTGDAVGVAKAWTSSLIRVTRAA